MASRMLCQKTALKMSASLPSWLVAAVATTMLWASIILPMTPPVLLEVQISIWAWPKSRLAAGVVDLGGRDLLQAAEQGVAAGVGAGEEHAQPAEQRGEEWVKDAGAGEGDAQRGVHAGVARHVTQPEHEGDGRDRDLHLEDGAPE